jgi:hypothetical protein
VGRQQAGKQKLLYNGTIDCFRTILRDEGPGVRGE